MQEYIKFAKENKLTIDQTMVDSRPDRHDFDSSVHFYVTLKKDEKPFYSFFFSCGVGLFRDVVKSNFSKAVRAEGNRGYGHGRIIESFKEWQELLSKKLTDHGKKAMKAIASEAVKKSGKPFLQIEEVLYSLQMDSMGSDESFSDWADSLGYSCDSIKAKEVYEACQKTAQVLRNQLGLSKFSDFLELTED